jgi:hypothetical protein
MYERDKQSKALIATDTREYAKFVQRQKEQQTNSKRIASLEHEINTLREMLIKQQQGTDNG